MFCRKETLAIVLNNDLLFKLFLCCIAGTGFAFAGIIRGKHKYCVVLPNVYFGLFAILPVRILFNLSARLLLVIGFLFESKREY